MSLVEALYDKGMTNLNHLNRYGSNIIRWMNSDMCVIKYKDKTDLACL